MQALRLSSFMNRPTLLSLETLLLIGPYLINTGRFLDAYTLFGLTIRVAQGMGLHRAPHLLSPPPPTTAEGNLRQTLWWWLLHLDAQYSMTLGRPLGISGVGDCPPPGSSRPSSGGRSLELGFPSYEDNLLSTSTTTRRFTTYLHNFTLLTRQILGASDLMTNGRIDDFTDKLLASQATLPSMIQFHEGWTNEQFEIPVDWPMNAHAALAFVKCHTYLILLNQQRIENGGDGGSTGNAGNPQQQPPPPLRGLVRVLASCRAILKAFEFFHTRLPLGLMDWSLGQQAFNAAMLLALTWTAKVSTTTTRTLAHTLVSGNCGEDMAMVTKAYRTFVFMAEHLGGGTSGLAGLAARQLGRMLRAEGIARSATSTARADAKKMDRAGHHGGTGMLLLEDPGLQGWTQEALDNPLGDWKMMEVMEDTQQNQLKRRGGLARSTTAGSMGGMVGPTPGSLSNTSSLSVPTSGKTEAQVNLEAHQHHGRCSVPSFATSSGSLAPGTTPTGAVQRPQLIPDGRFEMLGNIGIGTGLPTDFSSDGSPQIYTNPFVASPAPLTQEQPQQQYDWNSNALLQCSRDTQPPFPMEGVMMSEGLGGMLPPGPGTW